MKLSKRMKCITDMVTPGKRVADIGCDHAFVSIYLIQEQIADRVYAMDVAKGPLEIAKANIDAAGLGEYITTRLSDGMDKLEPGETDCAIIAGMGGYLVIDIVKKGLGKLQDGYEFVLSPQSDMKEVRAFLRQNAVEIINEKMLQEDGKYYNIIKAVYRGKKFNATAYGLNDTNESEDLLRIYDTYGKHLIEGKSQILRQYLQERVEKLNSVFCNLSKQTGERGLQRMGEIRTEVDEISKVLSML